MEQLETLRRRPHYVRDNLTKRMFRGKAFDADQINLTFPTLGKWAIGPSSSRLHLRSAEVRCKEIDQLCIHLNQNVVHIPTRQNAADHSDHQKKEINIEITEKENFLVVKFKDNGEGIDPEIIENESAGLGMMLINSFVKRQLDGDLSIINENGANIIFTCKKV